MHDSSLTKKAYLQRLRRIVHRARRLKNLGHLDIFELDSIEADMDEMEVALAFAIDNFMAGQFKAHNRS